MKPYFWAGLTFLCCTSAFAQPAKPIAITITSPNTITASTVSGTVVAGYSKEGTLLFSAGFPLKWNTYTANTPGELSMFVRTKNMDTPFRKIPRASSQDFHNAYLTKSRDGVLVFEPKGGMYKIDESEGGYAIAEKSTPRGAELFRNLGYEYSFGDDTSTSTVSMPLNACRLTPPLACERMDVAYGSVIFAYGGNDINTVAVTNQGDVLFHSAQGWCRGEKNGESFRCRKGAPIPESRGGWQLYSSIKTSDGTLMGEYPTGRFWKLGDGELIPTSLSPYSDASASNIELQSVSLFCGELHAGFYPNGEIWRRRLEDGKWEKIYQLFSHPGNHNGGKVPYRDMLVSGKFSMYGNGSFFGQRATSMVRHQNSLFIASGNLGEWGKDVPIPPFMTKEQFDEYGLVHYKTDTNCLNTILPEDELSLRIELSSDAIRLFQKGKKIAETSLHDFDVGRLDRFEVGNGVHGTLSDKQMRVEIER